MLATLYSCICWAPLALVCGIFGAWLVPHVIVAYLASPQDLKKKYNAEWALVTGASSGIGKAITEKLAMQGLNVVVVALQDKMLDDTFATLESQFPQVKFIKVGCDLGSRKSPGYMEDITKATVGIDVQIVFNNAGFMLTGFFDKRPLAAHLTNVECNAVCGMQISHHFVSKMLAKSLKGCVVFTSSAAACQPSPFSCLYASTKAFVSSFAASLACEVKCRGIDVCAVHPSPVASNFYNDAHKIDVMEFFKKMSVQPEELPDEIFKSIGRCTWRDIGAVALIFRGIMKVADYNAYATLISHVAPYLPDFKRNL